MGSLTAWSYLQSRLNCFNLFIRGRLDLSRLFTSKTSFLRDVRFVEFILVVDMVYKIMCIFRGKMSLVMSKSL
jgi:hypothetical protein